jgi:23S rRNA pseudouridine1911/1915/1917 synthase
MPAPLTLEERIRGEARIERLLTNQARIVRIRTGHDCGMGWRLDRYLGACCPSFARSMLQRWCKAGYIQVDGRAAKASEPVRAERWIEVNAPLPELPDDDYFNTDPLDILATGRGWLVVNKPPGQLAHQAGRVLSGTLLNHLQEWLEQRGEDPQAACLVNRIDKDTSGLVLCAYDKHVAGLLGSSLARHDMEKVYLAICQGQSEPAQGDWRNPIGDDPAHRLRRIICADGQPSHTAYQVLETAPHSSLLRLRLHTGRQHQIRIHAAHNGHPLVGDWLYGQPCQQIRGQCLHAHQLVFDDPDSGETRTVIAPLPRQLQELWQRFQSGEAIQPRDWSETERSKLGLSDATTNSGGWRRPSWLSEEEFQNLSEPVRPRKRPEPAS